MISPTHGQDDRIREMILRIGLRNPKNFEAVYRVFIDSDDVRNYDRLNDEELMRMVGNMISLFNYSAQLDELNAHVAL